jgi:hypothetical protein
MYRLGYNWRSARDSARVSEHWWSHMLVNARASEIQRRFVRCSMGRFRIIYVYCKTHESQFEHLQHLAHQL